MRTALTTAGERRREKAPDDLYCLVQVEVYVHLSARRFAAQQTDVLPVSPILGYLLLGNPQRLPTRTARILLADGNRNNGRAAADEGGGSAASLLRAHANTSPSTIQASSTVKASE